MWALSLQLPPFIVTSCHKTTHILQYNGDLKSLMEKTALGTRPRSWFTPYLKENSKESTKCSSYRRACDPTPIHIDTGCFIRDLLSMVRTPENTQGSTSHKGKAFSLAHGWFIFCVGIIKHSQKSCLISSGTVRKDVSPHEMRSAAASYLQQRLRLQT